jgi:hypothetical protein
MSPLRQQLRRIVADFVSSVVDALDGASLGDFVRAPGIRSARNGAVERRRAARPARPAVSKGRGRRKRASAEEVQQLKDLALETARALGPGFRKGDVMKRSGSRTDLGRALSLLVKEGKLAKKGDRRKARYWVS